MRLIDLWDGIRWAGKGVHDAGGALHGWRTKGADKGVGERVEGGTVALVLEMA